VAVSKGALDTMCILYREKWWVIDVGGGNLRVMFFADFERGKIFIKHITTHAEYDKLTDFYRDLARVQPGIQPASARLHSPCERHCPPGGGQC
jgi:hypothetical protein